MATSTITALVAADAEARVVDLGMRRELDQMLEHTLQNVTGLRAVRVTLECDPACPGVAPRLVIWAHRDDLPADAGFDRTDWDWGGWQTATFSPEVCRHFVMLSVYGDADGR